MSRWNGASSLGRGCGRIFGSCGRFNVRPPDVLYVPSHVLPIVHPRRCVATVHDLGYVHFPQAHRPWSRRYLDWSTRFNARQARRVIVDSMATRSDLITCYGVH